MTTSALGLALSWSGRVLLAECDPMGRRVLPGFMADRMRGPAGPGLLGLAMRSHPDPHAELSLEEYLLPIDADGQVQLLHGVRDPRHASQLAGVWQPMARELAARDGDVIADLGRLGGAEAPVPLLEAADVVVMLLKPTLAQVDAAAPRLEALRAMVGKSARVGLCLVADGPYSSPDVEKVLKAPVLGELPFSPGDARVLSDGAPPRRTFRASLLMRSLESLGRRVRATATEPATDDDDPSTGPRTAISAATEARR